MKMNDLVKCISVGMFLAAASAQATRLSGDAEAASHGDEATSVQLVRETEQKAPDFVFRQYNLAVIANTHDIQCLQGF